MAQFRESGVTEEVTAATLSADAFFVMATPVGSLDEVMPQDVFLEWLLDPAGPIQYVPGDGATIAADSVTEAMLTPAVQTKLNNSGGGGGSSRRDGFEDLGTVSTSVDLDFDSGTYANKRFELTGVTILNDLVASTPGAYELMVKSNGHAFITSSWLDVEPTFTADGWTVLRLYLLPDNTWTW